MPQLRALWRRIHEPRIEKLVYFTVYLGVVALAVTSLVFPPPAFEDPLGPVLTRVWVGLWALSGLGAAAVVLRGWWAFERVCIALGLLGIAIYSFAVFWVHLAATTPRMVETTVLWLGAAFYVTRLVRIWGPDFEPRH